MEAWRSMKGLPVYEFAPAGHATLMYGAFVPPVQAELFRLFGPNNVSGRALSLVSALLTVTLIAIVMRSGRSVFNLAVSLALVLGVNHRSGQYFAENRPDMPALLCATVSLCLMGFALEKRRWLYTVLGSACLVAGFFFKQSVAVIAAVPLVVLLLRARRPNMRELFIAICPCTLICLVVIGIKWRSPVVYHYMIEVPGGYKVNWPRAVKFAWELLLDSPLFLFLVGEWIVVDKGSIRNDARIAWLLALLAVGIPFGAVAHAKVGGWSNNLLPAFLGMTAFSAHPPAGTDPAFRQPRSVEPFANGPGFLSSHTCNDDNISSFDVRPQSTCTQVSAGSRILARRGVHAHSAGIGRLS